MGSEESQAVVDTTMWTSLLHAGLAGSFLKLPHVPPDAEALSSEYDIARHSLRSALRTLQGEASSRSSPTAAPE